MAKKVDREKHKKKPHGLERMIFLGIFIFATLLTYICLLAGISQYLVHTFDMLKNEASHELALVLANVDLQDMEELFAETKAIYEAVADDYDIEDAYPGGADKEKVREYSNLYSEVMDDGYSKLKIELYDCREATEMEDIAFTFFDEKRNRLVCVVDGDIAANCYTPGQWREGNIPTAKRLKEIVESEFALDIERGSFGGWSVTDYIPIYDRGGELIGYASVFWDITDVMHRIRRFIFIALPIIILLVTLFAGVISRGLRKRLVSPVLAISGAAREYAAIEADELETADSVFDKIDIEGPVELNELLAAMKSMEESVANDLRQIRTITTVRERVETELAVARNIQMSLLPDITDEISAAKEFDLFGLMTPAHEVGGDFYDFFMADDGHLVFLVADVSDKGAGAAMFMAVSRSMIRMRALTGGSPSEVFSDVDKLLSEFSGQKMFVTAWMGMLDLETGRLAVCNAGHEYPALYRKTGGKDTDGFFIRKQEHGSPLAFLPGLPFPECEITLNKGDRLFLFTDGVTEAHNAYDELFGTDRLLEVLNDNKDCDVRSQALALKDAVDEFASDTDQFDDITIFGLEYNGG